MEYKYDAFISYRHCDLDKFVAENLHKILETYELPKNIKEKLNIKGRTIKRVFRDQEELPLSSNLEDPIIEALKDSKYLIVICSPRLKDSLWCKKEIETFKKLRGRKNIFCVLIEGEPKDSFPEEVLYDEEVVKGKKTKKLVEPLAADVRGLNKKEVLNKIKEEKLRLIAPMYNLDYDDLRQRHKLRRQRQILMTSIIVASACLLFALYTGIMLLKITSQQKMLKNYQASTLSSESLNYLKNDSRYNAIKSAYQALTKFNGVKMPYTSEAEYALSESLGVYNAGSSYKSINEIDTKGVASLVKSSENYNYAVIYDESDTLTLIDKNFKVIGTYNDISGMSVSENTFSFIGNKLFSYINKDGNIILVNTKDGKINKTIKKNENHYTSLKGDTDGNYLSYTDENNLYIYSIKDKKLKGTIKKEESYIRELYFSSDNKYLFAGTEIRNYTLEEEDYITMHVIRLEDTAEINSIDVNAGFLTNIITKGDNAYMLFNRIIGVDNNTLLVSYNYIDGNKNWDKSYDNTWGTFITRSYPEDSNNVTIVTYDTVRMINMDSSDEVKSFTGSSEVIGIYSFYDSEVYLVLHSDNTVTYMGPDFKDSIEYAGKYEFNLESYKKVTIFNDGLLLIPTNENRVIYYEPNSNKNIKEEDIKLDYPSDDSIMINEFDKVKKDYNLKNKSLVNKIFYSDNKELMFVNYTNYDLAVYNVKDKTLLNTITNMGTAEHYFGKDKCGRYYIGDVSDAYIIDSNYNKVGHIKGLAKLEKDRVIISSNNKYYSLPIYTLNDLLKEAEKYLK